MNAIAAFALLVLTAEPAELRDQSAPSFSVNAEAGIDVLAANVVNTSTFAGSPSELTAAELGLSARLHASAFDSRAHVDVDYLGRQPFAGNSQDSAIHLLYQAEVSGDFVDNKLTVGLGRFLAPAAELLPVDGLHAKIRFGKAELQLFGGRRAISSSDISNVALKTFLPAAGATVGLAIPRLTGELGFAYSRDQLPLLMGTSNPQVDASSAFVRANGRPLDWLVVGGEVSLAQRSDYVLGPTWNSIAVTAANVDLFHALGFVEVRPSKSLRIAYDIHYQQAELFRGGVQLSANDPAVTAVGFVPNYLDNRLKVKWRPFELGWLVPEARFRLRQDWNELRAGIAADLAPEWALGLCVRASFAYDKMVQRGNLVPPSDRSFWSASLGWRGHGLDVALGASDVERAALPISGRVYTPYNDTPTVTNDLSPFVLGAERIAFVRAFYGSGIWFAGVDFEQSLTDARERRVFAQVGARLDKEW